MSNPTVPQTIIATSSDTFDSAIRGSAVLRIYDVNANVAGDNVAADIVVAPDVAAGIISDLALTLANDPKYRSLAAVVQDFFEAEGN